MKRAQQQQQGRGREAGFSLIELIIAMGLTLTVMSMASILLAEAFGIRSREHVRVEAIADAQRGLNILSREVANSGFGLTGNGIVAADSNANSIRVRANLNSFGGAGAQNATTDADEDLIFSIIDNGVEKLIYRHDVNSGVPPSPLADRVDSLEIEYLDEDDAEVAPDLAKKVRLTIGVLLPTVGNPSSPGYQPASRTQVMSEVSLRNGDLTGY
ncbi:MAG TPA: prepilin-type N-terminal cleavage/methylation domain-containing protein [Pyrinomonadaceae bacterium]